MPIKVSDSSRLSPWRYRDEDLIIPPPDSVGFVYRITNHLTSRMYIGKKLFWGTRKKLIKGKEKRVRVESDWKRYCSSSIELQEDIMTSGSENFSREILHLCSSKGVMSYLEMKEQIVNDVLLDEATWYNAFVGGKIHRNHVRPLFKIYAQKSSS